MTGKALILGLSFLLICSSLAVACDVNLIAMFTGEKPEDVFLQMVLRLARDTRALGQSFNNREETNKLLKQLMVRWVEFDNKYSQSPPLWAKNDAKWQSKLKAMADIIGCIQKDYRQNNFSSVHRQILSLSRRLANLFSALPMAPDHRMLLGFSQNFENLWEAFYEKDRHLFGQAVASLSSEVNGFRTRISSERRNVTDDFFARVEKLKLRCRGVPASMT